jgi:hypothetical protein
MPVKRPAEQAAESAVLVKNTYLAKCAKLTEEVCVGVYKGLYTSIYAAENKMR